MKEGIASVSVCKMAWFYMREKGCTSVFANRVVEEKVSKFEIMKSSSNDDCDSKDDG